MGNWLKYAAWEASQKEWERARSVYERALDTDYKHQPTWLRYAEVGTAVLLSGCRALSKRAVAMMRGAACVVQMEMKNKFINHARNLWDRAVTLLPRCDVFW